MRLHSHGIVRRLAALVIALACGAMATGAAYAQDASPDAGKTDASKTGGQDPLNTVVFAGAQADVRAEFVNVGATLAAPSGAIGHGLAVRASVYGGTYNYGANGQRIDAHFSGAELDALWQVSSNSFWMNTGPGVRYAHTTLSPIDPNNRRLGSKTELALTTDGGKASGIWRADWYASYGTQLKDYQVRADLTHHVQGRWRVGAEAGVEGDPTYFIRRAGVFTGYALDKRSEVQVSGGWSDGAGRGQGGYMRLGIYRTF